MSVSTVAMFDPTILLHLQPTLPPARPDLVIERSALTPAADVLQRIADRRASRYEADISAWIAELRGARDRAGAIPPTRDMTDDELALVGRAIEEIEAEAELRALGLKRLSKRVARDAKRNFARDASVGAAVRALGDRLIRAEEAAIEALLDHALHLRAFRAARSPGARGGPVFDDAAALDAYLRAELA